MYSIHVLIALVISSCTDTALAAPPFLLPRSTSGDGNGDSGGSGPGSIQPQIWIPLVVIAALFVLGVIVACSGRRLRRSALLSWGNGAAQAAGVTTGTTPASGAREITADQLAGSQRANGANATAAGTNRARRPRRARRTPSQISTHSLPAYMKEPGEQEIVIVRGADGLDEEIPITVEMPPVDEHGADTPDGSIDLTRATTYSPVPHTSNDVPLLHGGDLDSRQHLSPDHPGLATRASFDSTISSAEGSSQHYLDDAPPYETVILNDEPVAVTSPSYPPAAAAPAAAQERTSAEQSGTTRRRSMFASIFNPRHSRGPSATSPPPAASPEPRSSSGHTREGSGPSVMSVPASEQRRSRMIRHQPSHSGSNSMFSLLSRTRSNGNLNGAEGLTSPSLISLHSISSPLTHTLVKTELTYPKGGPTPEQLRLIASRESIMRFGKPYGPDAIAYAASSSRIDLEPPPGFEEVAGPSGAGPSGSSESAPGRDSPSSGSSNEEDGQPSAAAASPLSGVVQEEPVAESHVLTDVEEVESPVAVAPSVALAPEPVSIASSLPVESTPVTSPTATSLPPATSSSPVPAESSSSASRSSPAPAPAPSSASNSLSAKPATSNAPPSAFKAAFVATPTSGSFPARAASRASSYMSYATAEESLHTPTAYDSQFDLSGREDDAYESAAETAPSTPRITPRHTHEATDTTIHG